VKESIMRARKEAGKAGWVYAVSNPSMPGILKIGRTAREPDARLREMNGRTETPTPFRMEAVIRSVNAPWTERAVHERLAARRVNDRREFFRVTPAEALTTMEAVASEQRQIAYDRKGWAGSPPILGGISMTIIMTPVVCALDARLLPFWLGGCLVAGATGRPRTLREFLNISRRTGWVALTPLAAAALAYAVVAQDVCSRFGWIAHACGGLSLAAVRGTIGI
jgi:hypothetical protein